MPSWWQISPFVYFSPRFSLWFINFTKFFPCVLIFQKFFFSPSPSNFPHLFLRSLLVTNSFIMLFYSFILHSSLEAIMLFITFSKVFLFYFCKYNHVFAIFCLDFKVMSCFFSNLNFLIIFKNVHYFYLPIWGIFILFLLKIIWFRP